MREARTGFYAFLGLTESTTSESAIEKAGDILGRMFKTWQDKTEKHPEPHTPGIKKTRR